MRATHTTAAPAHARAEGRYAVFAIVDHATGEAWVDASPRRDRWAAADLLRAEIDFLGIARSPAFHSEPETNGCVEKFIPSARWCPRLYK